MAEESAAHPGIAFQTELAPVLPVQGHADQLRGMLGHLLKNAYEAISGGKGSVELSTATDARGWVVLERRARPRDGQMPPEVHERAVEPFFSTKPAHLGVGLSIANGVWRRHRGTLSIRTQPVVSTVRMLSVELRQGVKFLEPCTGWRNLAGLAPEIVSKVARSVRHLTFIDSRLSGIGMVSRGGIEVDQRTLRRSFSGRTVLA